MQKFFTSWMRTAWIMMLLALPSFAMAEKEAWVEYDSNTNALTFCYGENKTTATGNITVYGLNSGEDNPGWWTIANSVKTVTISADFADARPTTCSHWFYNMTNITEINGLQYLNTSEVTSMSDMFLACHALKTVDVSKFDTQNVTTMNAMFCQCRALTTLDLTSFDNSKVTDATEMFRGDSQLTTINVSNKFLFKDGCKGDNMFYDCTGLTKTSYSEGSTYVGITKAVDVSRGGYLNVTSPVMAWVGYKDGVLTFNYDNQKYNTTGYVYDIPTDGTDPEWTWGSSVTSVVIKDNFANAPVVSCRKWFKNLSKITSIEGLQNINTENVTDMSEMFNGCNALTNVDLSKFNTAKVTTMAGMFGSCSALTSLDVTMFDTSNVTDMSQMFYACTGLSTLDVTKLNTEKVTNMNSMFYACSGLTTLDVTKFITKQVTDMGKMFYGCSKLSPILNLTNFNTAQVTDMASMFENCSALTKILVNSEFIVENVTSSYHMLYGCSGLTGYSDKSEEYNKELAQTIKDGGLLTNIDVELEPWAEYQAKTNTLTFHYDGVKLLTEATAKYDIAETYSTTEYPGWVEKKDDITKVVINSEFAKYLPTSTSYWFADLSNLTEIEGLEYLLTNKVKDMNSMFYNCSKLASLDLSHFETGTVTDMSFMFSKCGALQSLVLGDNFLTQSVTSMDNMFAYCEVLPALDLTHFETSNVTNMDSMFKNMQALTELDLTSFNTTSVTNANEMFYDCRKLVTINVSKDFQLSSGTDMFKGCVNLVFYSSSSVGVEMAKDYTLGGYLYNKDVAPEPWAEYDTTVNTLTFHYNKMRGGKVDYRYTLSEASTWNYYASYFKKVIFDEEFKDARPTSCRLWFKGMTQIESITGLEYLNTEDVTDMSCMFQGCTAMKTIDITHFNTAKVTNMDYMFDGDSGLTDIIVSDKFTVDNLVAQSTESLNNKGLRMFQGCTSLTDYSNAEETDMDATKAKYLSEGGYFTNPAKILWAKYDEANKSFTYYYNGKCGKNYSYKYDRTSDWVGVAKTANVTSLIVDKSVADYKTTDMSHLFTNINFADKITGLEYLNTEGVTNMEGMFANSHFSTIDLTHFNMESVTNTTSMFHGCQRLKNIYVSKDFTVDGVTSSSSMFYNCPYLTNIGASSSYDKSRANYTNSDGCLTLRQHFSVGDESYAIDQTSNNACPLCYDDVTFTDGEKFATDADFQFASEKKASYSRTLSNAKWATLCLPFAYSVSDNSSCKYYTLSNVTEKTITLTEITEGTIKAGTPLMVYCENGTIDINATAAPVVSAPANAESGNRLNGTFESVVLPDKYGCYFIAKDKFYSVSLYTYSSHAVKVNPYRAHILTDSQSSAKYASVLDIETDDEVTGINSVMGSLNADAEYYDASGRRQDSLQKGLNIVKRGNKTIKIMIK